MPRAVYLGVPPSEPVRINLSQQHGVAAVNETVPLRRVDQVVRTCVQVAACLVVPPDMQPAAN